MRVIGITACFVSLTFGTLGCGTRRGPNVSVGALDVHSLSVLQASDSCVMAAWAARVSNDEYVIRWTPVGACSVSAGMYDGSPIRAQYMRTPQYDSPVVWINKAPLEVGAVWASATDAVSVLRLDVATSSVISPTDVGDQSAGVLPGGYFWAGEYQYLSVVEWAKDFSTRRVVYRWRNDERPLRWFQGVWYPPLFSMCAEQSLASLERCIPAVAAHFLRPALVRGQLLWSARQADAVLVTDDLVGRSNPVDRIAIPNDVWDYWILSDGSLAVARDLTIETPIGSRSVTDPIAIRNADIKSPSILISRVRRGECVQVVPAEPTARDFLRDHCDLVVDVAWSSAIAVTGESPTVWWVSARSGRLLSRDLSSVR